MINNLQKVISNDSLIIEKKDELIKACEKGTKNNKLKLRLWQGATGLMIGILILKL